SGLTAWALGIPTSLLMRQSPEKYGALPDGDVATSSTPSTALGQAWRESRAAGDFTLGEALRTRAFWFISGGHSLGLVVVSAVAVHQFAHMEEGVGLSAGAIATVITLLSSFNILGRLVGGITGDRFDKRYLAAAGMVGSATSLVILATAASFWQALLFGLCYGFFWGLRGPMADSLRGDYFGRASFGKISGMASLINMLGSICGPIFAGFMADVQGNYKMGFVILAMISSLGSVLFLLARRPAPPKRLIVPG
ncbi:MAG: MFS transporter, partial [Chloroflexi bacterium]|nr:MFS transporter [Chloroflexota bacterium]